MIKYNRIYPTRLGPDHRYSPAFHNRR
jgi:hypothetical protein